MSSGLQRNVARSATALAEGGSNEITEEIRVRFGDREARFGGRGRGRHPALAEYIADHGSGGAGEVARSRDAGGAGGRGRGGGPRGPRWLVGPGGGGGLGGGCGGGDVGTGFLVLEGTGGRAPGGSGEAEVELVGVEGGGG